MAIPIQGYVPPITSPEILQIQNKIGRLPWQNDKTPPRGLNNVTTGELFTWATHNGMPRSKAFSLSRERLEKCYYTNQNYFHTVAGLRPRKIGKPSPMSLLENMKEDENFLKDILQENNNVYNTHHVTPSLSPIVDQRPQNQDPIKDLLNVLNSTIDQKIGELNTHLIKQALEAKKDVASSVLRDVVTRIELGELKIELGKELENKILTLIRSSSDEIIFSSLAKRDQALAREEGEGVRHEEEEIETSSLNHNSPNSSFIPEIDPCFYFDPFATRVIRKAIALGRNVIASGDTGCGKTATFMQVCAVLGKGIIRVNPHDGITKESLVGGVGLKNGETHFQYGALPIAMKEGLVFLLDEADYLPPNLAAVFNPITERGGKLYIPETGETILPSPGFCVFATMNTGGKGDNSGNYTGTEVLNTAWLDRFDFMLKMDYLPQDKEYEMLAKRFPSLDEGLLREDNELEKLLKLARDVRQAFSQGELAITLSTRKLISYFEQRENNFSQIEALRSCLLNWLDDDDKNLVKTMLDRLQISVEE
jgi:cobaltochelatase CobS